jgi:hypothetical protein
MKGMHEVIPLEIYPFRVIISINETDDELFNVLKDVNTQEECKPLMNMSSRTTGRTVLLHESNDLVIRLITCPNKYEMLGIIHHEILHATFMIHDRIGCDYVKHSTNESFTYLSEYLFKCACKIIKI